MAELSEWDVTVTMVRTVDGRKETRDFTMRVPAAGTSGAESAARGIGCAVNEGSGYAWKFASGDPIRVRCVRGRAVVPADGLVKVGWYHAVADAGTAEFDRLWAELENAPEPVVELGQEVDCCALAAGRHTRGGPDHCGLCGKPFDVPLPPASDETREHPGTGQPMEGEEPA